MITIGGTSCLPVCQALQSKRSCCHLSVIIWTIRAIVICFALKQSAPSAFLRTHILFTIHLSNRVFQHWVRKGWSIHTVDFCVKVWTRNSQTRSRRYVPSCVVSMLSCRQSASLHAICINVPVNLPVLQYKPMLLVHRWLNTYDSGRSQRNSRQCPCFRFKSVIWQPDTRLLLCNTHCRRHT